MTNVRDSRAADFWAVDCETDPFKHGRVPAPFIWGAYNPHLNEYHEFDTPEEFIFFTQTRGGIYYAHNGGKFDWHYILPFIEDWTSIKVINGRVAKFKIGEAEFRDSYSILPVPLAAYKKMQFDYRKLERDVRAQNMEEIREYLNLDCVWLSELVHAFRINHGNALTLAGASLRFYERMSGRKADNSGPDYYKRFKPFYAGGRVQAFERGHIEGPLKIIDINSAYPAAMMHDHPCGLKVQAGKSLLGLSDTEISRMLIRCRARSTGAFFFRGEDSLDFPADGEIREFHITGWEYLAARDTKTLHDFAILETWRFPNKVNFSDYVTHWYSERQTAKKEDREADQLIAKLFMNALYGKFGTDASDYKEYTVIPETHIYRASIEDKWVAEHVFSGRAIVSRPANDASKRYYNVATAASVTGYVRAFLWRSICEGQGVAYCDTDSLILKGTGTLDLDPGRLGAWKIEAEGTDAFIAGKKLYSVHLAEPDKNGNMWKSASKGVRLDPELIAEVALGFEITWKSDAPTFRVTNNVIYDKFTERVIPRKVTFQTRKVRKT